MIKQYQGKPVTVVRDAKAGDPKFVANTDQVIVTNADGSQDTVPRGALT